MGIICACGLCWIPICIRHNFYTIFIHHTVWNSAVHVRHTRSIGLRKNSKKYTSNEKTQGFVGICMENVGVLWVKIHSTEWGFPQVFPCVWDVYADWNPIPTAAMGRPIRLCVVGAMWCLVQSADARRRGVSRLLPQLFQGDDISGTAAQKWRVCGIRKGSPHTLCVILLSSHDFMADAEHRYSPSGNTTIILCNDLRDPDLSIASFGRLLKTHLFQQYSVHRAH